MSERNRDENLNSLHSEPRRPQSWSFRVAGVLLALLCLCVATGWYWMSHRAVTLASTATVTPTTNTPEPTPAPIDVPSVGGLKLFTTWPKDQNPALVLIFSGQTYGYLSPCGCSRPQMGGLERRANLMDSLRAKGWPVVGIDLGDVAPPKGVEKQNLLKYRTTMKSLAEMGYVAVGLGEYDFSTQLFLLLSSYTLSNPNKPPIILAANLQGVTRDNMGKVTKFYPRANFFAGAEAKDRPMVEGFEVLAQPGKPAFGIVSVIGPTIADKVVALDKTFDFPRSNKGIVTTAAVIEESLAQMAKHPANPDLKVLLYVGKMDEARAAAEAFPQFQIVLCQSDDSLPPTFPTAVNNGKTQIVQVGHKGQNVGAMGVFKTATGYDLRYQLIELTEEYLTPEGAEAEKNHKVLKLQEEYALMVKDQNLLKLHTDKQSQHSAQIQSPDAKLTYIGAAACAQCHPAEFGVWSKTKHNHAYEALEKYAKRPSNRQFDGECLICHTTGMEYQGGFKDAKTTPKLLNNGCENCHGPGSGHATQPTNKQFLTFLAPWKTKPTDKMPDTELMKKVADIREVDRAASKLINAEQLGTIDRVVNICRKCHDSENDPKFDIYKYFPQINHSNLKNAGLPANAK